MKTTISVVCSTCGTINKSGKMSCCGRGGSWFRKCGTSGNTKLHHTWHEGIKACNTWVHSKTTIDAVEQKRNDFYNGAGTAISTVVTVVQTLTFIAVNTSTTTPGTTLIVSPANTPANASPRTAAFFARNSVTTTSTPTNMSMIVKARTPTSTSSTVQGYAKLSSVVVYIIPLLIAIIQF